MTIDSAATFLASSVLIGGGIVVLISCAVVINQLLARYWVPFKFYVYRDAVGPFVATEPHYETDKPKPQ